MHHKQATKRLSWSMGSSIAIHCALLIAGWWFIDRQAKPTISPRVLVFTLEQSPLDDAENVDAQTILDTVSDVPIGDAVTEAALPDRVEAAPERSTDPIEKPNIDNAKVAVAPAVANPAPPPVVEPSPTETQQTASAQPLEALPEPTTATAVAKLTVEQAPHQISIAEPQPETEATVVHAAPPPTPISSQQEQMLNEQLQQWSERLDLSQLTEPVSWQHDGQSYSATFHHLPAGGDMELDQLTVEVLTEQDGQQLVTKMRMKKLAFSNYAQFIHRWDPQVQIHNDELDGRFHSNSEINLAYDRRTQPTFHGKVTVASRRVNINRQRAYRTREDIFRGGLQTGVKKILMPRRFLPFPDRSSDTEQVVHFDADTRIWFESNGTVRWQNLVTDGLGEASLDDQATYLLAEPGAALFVQGTVNGKALVYSPAKIVIEDDLVYAAPPDQNGDDYLGLVSDRNIEIAPPKVTGPGDLHVHGSIYAKRRFKVTRYRARHQGTLHLHGSLSAGSLTATEPRFATRINFDKRLENLRPPGFPVTDRYEVAGIDEGWQSAPPL